MDFNSEDLKKQFEKELDDLRKSVKRTNILVVGQTGVGKSSLINIIFGEDIASVSHTKPETRGFHKYASPTLPINIIDSEGYELDVAEKFNSSINDYIDSNFSGVEDQIHIAWYCISISGARVLSFDLKNIEFLLSKNIPTAVVFTQADNDTPQGDTAKSLSKIISDKFGSKVSTFQVSNDAELNKKELDLDKLVEWSSDNIGDENVRIAFIMGQKASMNLKFKNAQKIIIAAAASAALVGASPIPMSDAALLVPIQTIMTSKILHVYGLNVGVSTVLKNLIGTQLLTMLAKSAVGNLLKFIPGFGSVVGGAINAAVASTFTLSLGYAMCKLSEKLVSAELDGMLNEDVINSIFTKENLETFMNQYGKEQKS